MLKDTTCCGCGIYTAKLTEGGRGRVFCEDRCRVLAVGKGNYNPSREEAKNLGLQKDAAGQWRLFSGGQWLTYHWAKGYWDA
jgi:hypothetical protein